VKKKIHITLVSPIDVVKERNIVQKVCNTFNKHLKNSIEIVTHRYEYYPHEYHKSFQANFEAYHSLATSDLVVAILWYRLGTILPKNYTGKITGDQKVTGTQYEIEEAIYYERNLWVYHKSDAGSFTKEEAKEVGKQYQQLETFLDKIGLKFGKAKQTYCPFESSEFQMLLEKHLQAWLKKEYQLEVALPQKDEKNSIEELQLHPNYLVGLYASFIIVSLMAFLWMNATPKEVLSQTVRWIIWAYVLAIMAMGYMGIKALPTKLNGVYIDSFRVSFKKLLIRGAFMVWFASLFGLLVGFFGIPILKEGVLKFIYYLKE
jgi:hypothetical protein